ELRMPGRLVAALQGLHRRGVRGGGRRRRGLQAAQVEGRARVVVQARVQHGGSPAESWTQWSAPGPRLQSGADPRCDATSSPPRACGYAPGPRPEEPPMRIRSTLSALLPVLLPVLLLS